MHAYSQIIKSQLSLMASSILLASHNILSFTLLLTCSLPLLTSGLTSPLYALKDAYVMSLAIGTPPVPFSGLMDTGSDLIWTKCTTSGSSGFGSFDSTMSKTFSKVYESCESLGLDEFCIENYQDGNLSVTVNFGQDTISVEDENFPYLTFGCGTPDQDIPYDGFVGLGRGKLSLVSQLQENVFAICLGSRSLPQPSGVFLTGSEAISETTNTQTMPLLDQDDTYYYISLEGISVGETMLPVRESDFAFNNGHGGMIIDSGTTFTYLEKSVIDLISDEFMNQTVLEKYEGPKPNDYNELEHCFKPLGETPVPNLVFHFEGADWELPRGNYIYEKNGVACLAFIAKHNDQDVSIFGNMQQQNMMVIYDTDKNNLMFKPANCNLYL